VFYTDRIEILPQHGTTFHKQLIFSLRITGQAARNPLELKRATACSIQESKLRRTYICHEDVNPLKRRGRFVRLGGQIRSLIAKLFNGSGCHHRLCKFSFPSQSETFLGSLKQILAMCIASFARWPGGDRPGSCINAIISASKTHLGALRARKLRSLSSTDV
jgi:hypothetical protein